MPHYVYSDRPTHTTDDNHCSAASRGHLLKREVWERPAATLDRAGGGGGGGVQIEIFFPTKQLNYYATVPYPEPRKTACNYGNAHKIAQISFIIYYTKIITFLTFGNSFLLFSGGVGTPFPRVPLGNDPCQRG